MYNLFFFSFLAFFLYLTFLGETLDCLSPAFEILTCLIGENVPNFDLICESSSSCFQFHLLILISNTQRVTSHQTDQKPSPQYSMHRLFTLSQ